MEMGAGDGKVESVGGDSAHDGALVIRHNVVVVGLCAQDAVSSGINTYTEHARCRAKTADM